MPETPHDIALRLEDLLAQFGMEPLDPAVSLKFVAYYELLARWNARTNLSAIRDMDGILTHHFVESIACARALPRGIATLLDFGSGAGFPGIPIALCRPEIAVTLAESQGKKAAFLREAVRSLVIDSKVHAARAETLKTRFDCVTLRAVDRMSAAVELAVTLTRTDGWLAILTTDSDLQSLLAPIPGSRFGFETGELPGGAHRILALSKVVR